MDAAMAEHFSACPNCGESGGTPVPMGSGETSAVTGYQDAGIGCTLCCEDDMERDRNRCFVNRVGLSGRAGRGAEIASGRFGGCWHKPPPCGNRAQAILTSGMAFSLG